MQTYYIEIKMLIWTNFTTALKPLKVIPQKDGGPYSYQTKPSLKCSRFAVKDASNSKIARHYFLSKKAGKDMSTEQMFEQMYYNDFDEKGTQIGSRWEN